MQGVRARSDVVSARARSYGLGGSLSRSLLSQGESVFLTASGASCRIERLLGVGGQGEVYEATARTDSDFLGNFAFKCYHPWVASKDQWEALSALVDLGSPNGRFLWPQDLAEVTHLKTFGYLMALRDSRFVGLVDLVRRQVSTSFRSLTNAGFQLADSFLALHSRGLCYRDISLGNVFFDPANGDIMICDNDNVAIDGRGHESVLGTTGFMAPEIEREDSVPSTRTDLYSLSVLLFLIFVNHHPLQGQRELAFPNLDRDAVRFLFGTNPVFVFDPDDASNRPVPGVHDNALILWPLYPKFLLDLFVRAFTDGLGDPDARVRESTWKSAIARIRDAIVTCGCGAESFFDDDLGTIAGSPPGRCWACQGVPIIPPRLRLGRRALVVLNPDTTLFPHHLGGDLYDYSRPLGVVSSHPVDPRIQGLKNVSDETWEAEEPDGVIHNVLTGRSVRLSDGMRIRFSRVEGIVET